MFFFGLLSGNLPYFILMGLYFLGFGLYSTNSIREKLLSDNSKNDNKTFIVKASQKTFSKQKTYFFKQNSEQKNAHINEIYTFYSFFDHYKTPPPRDFSYSFSFQSKLFSRPPPVC